MRPLQDILVLDLTHMLSGPYGAMLLADLGARTIKVEPPGAGEGTRQLLAGDPAYSRDGMGAYFLTLNRGKESVAVDLKTADGRAVFHDLVRVADVVIDNFSVGVTKRLGIDHATLAAINPRIVTCSISGFGETGPHTDMPAFDQVVQGMGGGMSITGFPDSPPVRSGIPIGDLGGGAFGAMGVLAALVARATTGLGQHVDVSMLDVQVSLLNYMATMHLMSDRVPDRIGNSHFVHVPYNTYRTSDGHIIIACIGDAFFERFRATLPLPLLQEERYARQPARFADRALIDAAIEAHLQHEPSKHWLQLLREARIPCAPVNDLGRALTDPQVLARDMVLDVPLHGGGSVRMPGNPIKLSDDTEPFGKTVTAPPRLGEHTAAVLSELLGYDAAQIAALRDAQVVQ
jgi:crotonobetainyl-CoA:carnitine CoA-transferase CaiB-like acyl-CoA transferase